MLSRRKRDIENVEIDKEFTFKHITQYNGVTPVEKDEAEKLLTDLNSRIKMRNKKHQKRQVNTFLTTSQEDNTLNQIKAITMDFYTKNKTHSSNFYKEGAKKIVFDEFNIKDIYVTLIHVMNKNKKFQCWYSTDMNIAVGASVNDTFINIDHFNTTVVEQDLKICNDTPKIIIDGTYVYILVISDLMLCYSYISFAVNQDIVSVMLQYSADIYLL